MIRDESRGARFPGQFFLPLIPGLAMPDLFFLFSSPFLFSFLFLFQYRNDDDLSLSPSQCEIQFRPSISSLGVNIETPFTESDTRAFKSLSLRTTMTLNFPSREINVGGCPEKALTIFRKNFKRSGIDWSAQFWKCFDADIYGRRFFFCEERVQGME